MAKQKNIKILPFDTLDFSYKTDTQFMLNYINIKLLSSDQNKQMNANV